MHTAILNTNLISATDLSYSPITKQYEHLLKDHTVDDAIQTFVQRFLHNYIQGKITPSNELTDRRPMINILIEEIQDAFSLSNEEINSQKVVTKAFNSYIQTSINGYYAFLKTHKKLKLHRTFEAYEIDTNQKQHLTKKFKTLLKALLPALQKDFPDMKDLKKSNNFVNYIAHSLKVVNEKIYQSNIEACLLKDPITGEMMAIKDYQTKQKKYQAKRNEMKETKLQILEKNNCLFF